MSHLVRRSLVAAALAVPLALAGTASAGGFHVHFGGGGHWGGGVHVGGGAHWGGGWGGGYRAPHWGGGSVVVRGGIWVGSGSYWGGYYPYYYPSYYSYATPPPACDCGPSAYYPPVYPAPSTYAAMPQPASTLSTFGVGLYGGGTTMGNNGNTVDGNDVGLFANLRITRGLLIQGELGKTSMQSDARVDRRYGGALLWEIGAENSWAPYLLAGVGVEQADTTADAATQSYAEVGAGLRWAITPRLHLTADIRAGSRATMDNTTTPTPTRTGVLDNVTPPAAGSGQTEDFTRFRLGAMIYF